MINATDTEQLVAVKTKTNILVVDDRQDGLLALEAVLSCDSYNLVTASSGYEALQYALCYDFAVILLDVQMPELDGFETAKLLRENFRSKDTPIIFVTAISKEAKHINEGYESGAVDYIFKPLDPFILKSKVNIFVDLYKKNVQIKEQAALLREIESNEKDRQISNIQKENLRRFVALADAIPHMVVKVNAEGKVEYFNKQWCEYTGLESGNDWERVVFPKDKRKFIHFWLNKRLRKDTPSETEFRIKRKDNKYRWHLLRVVEEIKDEERIGWIATCTDVDDIKKADEASKQMSEELNRSNKDLEEFAYIASHDLKEPLHVVSSFTHLLEKRLLPKLDPTEVEYLKYIRQSVSQAQMLIKDLLEYSRLGQEKKMEVIDLNSVFSQVMISIRGVAENAKADIKSDPLPKIMANHLSMFELFQNLLVNAIKYRSEKAPEILISVKSIDDRFIFAVKDNGIGIDPQYKERIFDMFQRLHSKSEYSGTGIGLSICKKIVENHGGKIWVESRLGQGATFYFTIKKGHK
jgi:two-component system, sensor histidine kinase